MQVTPEDIQAIAALVNDLCGIVLDGSKGYLIDSRLSRLAVAAGCNSFCALAQKARTAGNSSLQNEIIDAITTQETLFFRDDSPFEVLRYRVIPDLIDARANGLFPKRLRLWSAASSTGQEVYSLAMSLCELLPDILTWDIRITATDISNSAIRQASLGQYADHEIQRGMKPAMLAKYFNKVAGGWKVKDELRSLVTFGRCNLLKPFVEMGPFDIIFCRNVAIYFDTSARSSLFHRLADRLVADGCLFVGSSESLMDLGPRFTPLHHCRATYYQPNKNHSPAGIRPAAASLAVRPAAAVAFSPGLRTYAAAR